MARREDGESSYLTDEQRSHVGWDGSAHQNVKLFLSEPLSLPR